MRARVLGGRQQRGVCGRDGVRGAAAVGADDDADGVRARAMIVGARGSLLSGP